MGWPPQGCRCPWGRLGSPQPTGPPQPIKSPPSVGSLPPTGSAPPMGSPQPMPPMRSPQRTRLPRRLAKPREAPRSFAKPRETLRSSAKDPRSPPKPREAPRGPAGPHEARRSPEKRREAPEPRRAPPYYRTCAMLRSAHGAVFVEGFCGILRLSLIDVLSRASALGRRLTVSLPPGHTQHIGYMSVASCSSSAILPPETDQSSPSGTSRFGARVGTRGPEFHSTRCHRCRSVQGCQEKGPS